MFMKQLDQNFKLFSPSFMTLLGLYNNCGNEGEVSPGTPYWLSNKMIAPLRNACENVFADKEKTFVFPWFANGMLIVAVIENLFDGLKQEIPDDRERIKHILEKQIFAFEANEVPFRRVKKLFQKQFAYKDLDIKLNIYYNDILRYLSQENSMEFDYWVLNPPYQERTTKEGKNPQAKDVYPDHIVLAFEKTKCGVIGITPSRFLDKTQQKKYKEKFINNFGLRYVCHTDNNKLFGNNVDIKGGVCFFYLDKNYKEKEAIVQFMDKNNCLSPEKKVDLSKNPDYFISRDDICAQILSKFSELPSIDYRFRSKGHFGIKTNDKSFGLGSIPCLVSQQKSKKSSLPNQFTTTNIVSIPAKKGFGHWKVAHRAADGKGRDYSNFFKVLKPGEVCSESYIHFTFSSEEEANNYVSYFQTKLFKFLFAYAKIKQDITKIVFRYIPDQDFSVSFSDASLYEKYALTEEEIQYIEKFVDERKTN